MNIIMNTNTNMDTNTNTIMNMGGIDSCGSSQPR